MYPKQLSLGVVLNVVLLFEGGGGRHNNNSGGAYTILQKCDDKDWK
jgi:hypothetical protein